MELLARGIRLSRLTIVWLLVLATITGTAQVSAAAASTSAATPPRDALTSFVCRQAINPLSRSIAVVSVMRPLPGTRSLSVRFELGQRLPGGSMTTVTSATGLGTWVTPTDPTLGQRPGDVWKLSKAVLDLSAPATYRLRVTFRWLGSDGRVLATRTLRSPACAQRELRPDLVVRRVSVLTDPGHTGQDRYRAAIANQGGSPSGPFDVLFSPGASGDSITRSVRSLASGQRTAVIFVGPVCEAGAPPTVVADPTDQVDDSNRANNTVTVTCPPTGAALDSMRS